MTLFQQRERNEASCFGEALISFSGSLSTRFAFAKKILFEQAKTSSLWNDEKIVSQYIFVSQIIKAASYVHQIVIRSPVPKKDIQIFS